MNVARHGGAGFVGVHGTIRGDTGYCMTTEADARGSCRCPSERTGERREKVGVV